MSGPSFPDGGGPRDDGGDGNGGDGEGSGEELARRVSALVTDRPRAVVVAFLVVSLVFLGGVGMGGEQQAGTDQFTADVEEQDALDAMEEDFSRGSRDTGGSSATLFVTDDRNVLSKPMLLRMLTAQERLEATEELRVSTTTGPASIIALQLDPTADTAEQQRRAVEQATSRELDTAIRDAANSGGVGPVSTDFTAASGSASVAQMVVQYDTPPAASTSQRAGLQTRTADVVGGVEGLDTGDNVVVFGDAVIEEEVLQLLTDTAIIVFPAALLLITFFLVVAYRDPVDLGLGIAALLMTLVWTFGFMGYANIPFSDTLVTVFPLLLAVGIDFGIHIINRYREERAEGTDIDDAMRITTNQLTGAFFIVTLTTVFGFAANLTSSLGQLQDFGIVAAVGIVFTFLIFGVFLPAGKILLDRLREGTRFPEFGSAALGREGSVMGVVLPIGAKAARAAPVIVLAVALIVGGAGAAYGTGVDTEFSQEAFFPDQDKIDAYQELPEPLAPSDYTFMRVLNHLEEDFDQGFIGTVTLYVQDRDVRSNVALDDVDRAMEDPPDAFASSDRRAEANSIVSVMESRAEADPEFAAMVDRYDTDGDGIPDREVDRVYDELLASGHGDQARNYLTEDRSATRIEYQLTADADQTAATAAAQETAADMRMDAVPTGTLVVNQVVIDRITESAIRSLIVAFMLTAAFLMVSYWWLESRAVYGLINLVPVLVTVGLLAGSMRLFDIPLTPFNAPILSVSIGLGVDYTVHYMHRFVDEYEAGKDVHEALLITSRGTGGALTGSMLTTVCGLGVLYLALIPLIAEFGILLALGVFYAYLASIFVLPSVIVVWDRTASLAAPVTTTLAR